MGGARPALLNLSLGDSSRAFTLDRDIDGWNIPEGISGYYSLRIEQKRERVVCDDDAMDRISSCRFQRGISPYVVSRRKK